MSAANLINLATQLRAAQADLAIRKQHLLEAEKGLAAKRQAVINSEKGVARVEAALKKAAAEYAVEDSTQEVAW